FKHDELQREARLRSYILSGQKVKVGSLFGHTHFTLCVATGPHGDGLFYYPATVEEVDDGQYDFFFNGSELYRSQLLGREYVAKESSSYTRSEWSKKGGQGYMPADWPYSSAKHIRKPVTLARFRLSQGPGTGSISELIHYSLPLLGSQE